MLFPVVLYCFHWSLYVEVVEVTTRHSGCQQQHLMQRWNWAFPVFQWTEPAHVAVLRKPYNLRSLGRVSKSLQFGAQVLLLKLIASYVFILMAATVMLGWASGVPCPWFPGFTWYQWTAAPAEGWPRSQVFWRCLSSRYRWAGEDWASPLAAASPDVTPRSGP